MYTLGLPSAWLLLGVSGKGGRLWGPALAKPPEALGAPWGTDTETDADPAAAVVVAHCVTVTEGTTRPCCWSLGRPSPAAAASAACSAGRAGPAGTTGSQSIAE